MISPPPSRTVVSPRFELFFALAAVLDPAAPTPPDGFVARWLAQARRKLDPGFRRHLELAPPVIWRRLSILPGAAALEGGTHEVIDALAGLPADAFANLAADPPALQSAAIDMLRRFDRLAFAAFWRGAAPGFTAIAQSLSPDRAVEPEADETIYFPSMFASTGHTAMLGSATGHKIAVRFLSAAERPDLPAPPPQMRAVADPAAIFRALGDATRYAIARLIAQEALSSAELARRLGVSGPTLTHHLRQLRDARLVQEERRGNSILLRLDRRTIDAISQMAAAELFGAQPVAIRRSRRA